MWERRSDSCESFVNGKPIVLIQSQYYSIGVHVLFFTAHQNSQTKLRQQLRSNVCYVIIPSLLNTLISTFPSALCHPLHSDFNLFDLSPFSSFYSLCQVLLALLFLGFVFPFCQFSRFLVRHWLCQSTFDWFISSPFIAWRLCCFFVCLFHQAIQHWCEIWFWRDMQRENSFNYPSSPSARLRHRRRSNEVSPPLYAFSCSSLYIVSFSFSIFFCCLGKMKYAQLNIIIYNLSMKLQMMVFFFFLFFGLIWCSSISVYLHFEIIINDTMSTNFPFEIDCCGKVIQFWQSYHLLSLSQKFSVLLIGFCTINEWLSFFPPIFSGDCGGFEVKWKPFTC